MTRFGDLAPLCRNVPSYPWCNLFYHQLQKFSNATLSGLSANPVSAPVGINPICGIPRISYSNSLTTGNSIGNIADIVCSCLSVIVVLALLWATNRREAAVGRVEFRTFLFLYLLILPFQVVSSDSLLEQGSTPLVAVTAIHAGLVAALFWLLLANGLVATQIVEDGSPSSLIPMTIFAVLFFAATTYISFDVGFGLTSRIGRSIPPASAHSPSLFVLTSVWPAAAVLIYFIMMTVVIVKLLGERRPVIFFIISAICFILAQLGWLLLGRVICKNTHAKLDGLFIATCLNTASVTSLFFGWVNITEEFWDEDPNTKFDPPYAPYRQY